MEIHLIGGAHEGDVLYWREAGGHTAEICDIKVTSERRVGRGRAMIEQLCKSLPADIRLVYAITRESNHIAQSFYQALGFRLLGVLYPFYRDTDEDEDEAALVYGKEL